VGDEDVRAYYDRLSAAYDRDRNRRFFELGLGKYLELIGPRPGRLLEVGCGTGSYLVELRRQGIDANGCDFAPQMCALARRNFRDAGFDGEAAIQNADAEQGTGFAEPFDTIVLMDCWETFPRPELVVRTLHRHLRPGGRLVLFTPNMLFRPLIVTLEFLRIKKLRPAFLYLNGKRAAIRRLMDGYFRETGRGTLFLGLELYVTFERIER
jgi:SAM-dependent methyltransferase